MHLHRERPRLRLPLPLPRSRSRAGWSDTAARPSCRARELPGHVSSTSTFRCISALPRSRSTFAVKCRWFERTERRKASSSGNVVPNRKGSTVESLKQSAITRAWSFAAFWSIFAASSAVCSETMTASSLAGNRKVWFPKRPETPAKASDDGAGRVPEMRFVLQCSTRTMPSSFTPTRSKIQPIPVGKAVLEQDRLSGNYRRPPKTNGVLQVFCSGAWPNLPTAPSAKRIVSPSHNNWQGQIGTPSHPRG